MRQCKSCGKLKAMNYYHVKKELHRVVCIACANLKAKLYRDANKDKFKERDLRRNFGISMAEYNLLLRKQNYVCAICLKPEVTTRNGKLKKLAVDHRHSDGTIRGLLCAKCNMAIGLLNENTEVLNTIRKYLLCVA